MTTNSKGYDELVAIAGSSFDRMRQFGNQPIPRNYEVWFAYFSGSRPDLSAMIDNLIDEHQKVGDADLEQIYNRFLQDSNTEHELRETTAKIEETVGQVLNLVGTAGADTRTFGEVLSGASGRLDAALDVDTLRSVTSELITNTRQMLQRSRVLEAQLSRSNQHILELRNHLVSVREEVMTDALTGIPNRRFFDSVLRELASLSATSERPLCLCMVDIDHFKQFNDRYGHQIGDQVLKLVAKVLRDSVKGRDVAARYGGEEFVILLPETRLRDATLLADQIRELVASKNLVKRTTGETIGSVNLSIGVSQYRRHESVQSFMSRADSSLYLAKNSGRNRVCNETMLAADMQKAS
ncbi:MAG: GGDEF domain-containing protein [Alphaproteobacteria bacterium]